MKLFILTDLEGAAGVDRFVQTRTSENVGAKAAAMKQLAREVNACVAGIHDIHSGAEIDVWDGHGPGGLFAEDIVNARYLGRDSNSPYRRIQGYDAMLFVGQHAMAGTYAAPLCHTYSSLHMEYYKLNGVFIGEFAARALLAGFQGVPTIYLSGDDKAVSEAKLFVPEIETTVTKLGTGLESAVHLDPDDACSLIRRDAAKAVQRIGEIPPFTGMKPPYTFEIRKREPWDHKNVSGGAFVDPRTFRMEADSLEEIQSYL
jgi:D-amino peptidase